MKNPQTRLFRVSVSVLASIVLTGTPARAAVLNSAEYGVAVDITGGSAAIGGAIGQLGDGEVSAELPAIAAGLQGGWAGAYGLAGDSGRTTLGQNEMKPSGCMPLSLRLSEGLGLLHLGRYAC